MSGRIAALVGLLVLVPVLVGPIVVGVVLEQRIEEGLARADVPFEVEYERGLFVSTARTRIPLAAASAESPVLTIDHVIVHGPIPLAAPVIGRSPLGLVAVWIRSTIDADPAVVPNVARALEGDPLVRLDSRVGFDGAVGLSLDAPPFALDEERFRWKGLVGEGRLSPAAGSGEGLVEMLGLEVLDGDTSVVVGSAISRLQIDLDAMRMQTVIDQEGLEASSAEGRVEMGPLHAESEAPLAGDGFGPSRVVATLAEISGGGGMGDAGFEVQEIGFAQEISVDDTTGLHRGEVRLGFERGRLGSRADDGPGGFTIVVDRIDRAAVVRFREAMQALETSGASPEQIEAMRPFAVLEQLPGVLASSPSVDVVDLVYAAPEGRLEGAFHASVDGSQPALLQDPFSLLGQLAMRASLSAPEALLRRLLAPLAAARVAEMQAEAGPGAPQTLPLHPVDAWLASGTLVREGDRLVMDARFENGFPVLNGQPVDPAVLMQLMPGM